MKRAELLEHNRSFIVMATALLYALRGTEDKSCSVCGANMGKQHRAGFVCRSLVEWRRSAKYGPPDVAAGGCDTGSTANAA